MDKENIKSRLQSFKEWQDKPFDYTFNPDEVKHCSNCEHDFIGNFCPVCSQKAGMGRIGWHSVRQGVMDIWGLGTRSLLYSIWQLLLRPGHIIGDYIDGKRQVSFPPVKMLFIVAVIYSMLFYWFIPDVVGINVDDPAFYKEESKAMDDLSLWIKNNYSWYSLIMAVLAVLPTWVMFRFSPRHTAHSLPEGFFIQVFLAVLMVVFSILFIPLAMVNPTVYTAITLPIYGVYYIIVYKYLFGYGLWGTLWRCGFILVVIYSTLMAVVFLVFKIDMSVFIKGVEFTEEMQVFARHLMALFWLLFAVVTFAVGFFINLVATSQDRKLAKENKEISGEKEKN